MYDIGDGLRVTFWLDRWFGETLLAVSHPKLFSFCRDKKASVAELMKFTNGGVLLWDVCFLGLSCSGFGGRVEFHFSKGVWVG